MKKKTKKGNNMKFKIGAVTFIAAFAMIFLLRTFSFVTIDGNEAAVRQDVFKGVMPDVWLSGTKAYCGWLTTVYKYDIGTQKITFDSQAQNKESEYPPIQVEVGENGGQRAFVSISVNYHINAEKLVTLHKQGIAKTYESVVLKREIIDIVNEIARPHKSALDLFSGAGFVEFKKKVEAELQNNAVLKDRGIEIENTIIYGVHLDPAYEAEIAAKQVAQQQALRKQEETKAAEQEAKRIFAMSQAEVEKARQIAEAGKITQVTQAQANAEQQILAAKAEKEKRLLEAEGERDANLAKAAGITAVGEAEAKVQALKRESLYAGESGARRAQVEIANAQAEKMQGLLAGVNVVSDRTIFKVGEATGALAINTEEPTK